MINIAKGIIAGLVASAALSGAVCLAAWAALVQAFDPVQAVSGIMLSPLGLSWVGHFALGTFLWGSLFSILSPVLPGPFWFKGVVFGGIAWLFMLVVTWAADPITLPRVDPRPVLFHLLFGVVLGSTYGILLDRSERQGSTERVTRPSWPPRRPLPP